MDLEEVKAAINKYFGDTTRNRNETLEGLEELKDDIGDLIVGLEEDIRREEESLPEDD